MSKNETGGNGKELAVGREMNKENKSEIPDWVRERADQVFGETKERDNDLRPWFKWLVSLAAGSLSVLVSLTNLDSMSLLPIMFFRAACICLGIAMFALSVRIHAFHVGKQMLIEKLAKSIEMKSPKGTPMTSDTPKWMMVCEPIGYWALIAGFLFLILFVCVPHTEKEHPQEKVPVVAAQSILPEEPAPETEMDTSEETGAETATETVEEQSPEAKPRGPSPEEEADAADPNPDDPGEE